MCKTYLFIWSKYVRMRKKIRILHTSARFANLIRNSKILNILLLTVIGLFNMLLEFDRVEFQDLKIIKQRVLGIHKI
jgi:hypothetical protein